ncbi:L-fucose mutarotase [Sulfuriroseicoccus oceanibius]|uniref:L-fucose mutarotase n=1 Tax=Sulfuriroseicoccus oceanibius TaxID=2707525 RepID=A0A6B3LDY5_9BACT|nr:L-fucose mutarotase [Sulfuriroseicoccus oceanibius]QQL44728.1 L-fucose mutarotase [Sulfuriroseicoccus oceanibius]
MLKGISPLFSPELLATIYRMGHGEELVLADAHFPAHQFNGRVIRADGLQIPDLLEAILPLFEIDSYADDPVVTMDAVPGDSLNPAVEASYLDALSRHSNATITRMERFAFYERVRNAHAVIATGDTQKYANIILKKGVTPV